MKKLATILAAFMLLTFAPEVTVNAQNTINPDNVSPCGTSQRLEELYQKHPQLRALHEQIDKQQNEWVEEYENTLGTQRGVIYRIPIVFHILHGGGPENISEEQVFDAVEVLNRDFRKLNADVNNVHSSFQGITADIEIEFELATIAPNGQCFKGITRTLSTTAWNETNKINDVRYGNDVSGSSGLAWAPNKYLNIFVTVDIGGAAGYTYRPTTNTSVGRNSIYLLHNYVGRIGTGSENRSRILTHEVGHWLNLLHTWGSGNDPGLANNCNNDDFVNDTPNTWGWTTCNVNGISCDGVNKPVGTVDNVENYMEYSYCSKMFTAGQKTRMRAAATSTNGGRNNLWTTANLNSVGANGNGPLCKAEFKADRTVICAGETVTFTDLSYHNVTGRTWTLTGASPASSSQQNPTVTYSTPGTYNVALQVTDGSSTVSGNLNNYIVVLPSTGRGAPFSEGFETMTTLPTNEWYTTISGGTNNFAVTTAAAASGTKSLRVNNTSGSAGTVHEFVSKTIDLSNANSLTLSFKYAFAKKAGGNTDLLRVWVSNDCGANWLVRRNISSNQIATAPNTTGNFVPTAAQWTTIDITNIASSYYVSNFMFKFEYTNGGGNHLYIDDINLQGTFVGVDDINQNISGLSIFPNPTIGSATVRFSLTSSTNARVTMLDMLGREVSVIANGTLSAGEQQFQINRNGLAGGIYMIKVEADGEQIVKRVVFE